MTEKTDSKNGYEPRLRAYYRATVVPEMMKAMNFLYRDLSPRERRPYVREFKILLHRYLEGQVEHPIK